MQFHRITRLKHIHRSADGGEIRPGDPDRVCVRIFQIQPRPDLPVLVFTLDDLEFHLDRFTSSGRIITDAMMKLFDRRVDPNLLVRRITVVAAHVLNEKDIPAAPEEQPDLFADYEALKKKKAAEQAELDKEKRLQQTVLNIKKRMGANAILKGMNLEKGATGKVRNEQIGGHRK